MGRRRRLRRALLHVRRGPRPLAAPAPGGLGRRRSRRPRASRTTTSFAKGDYKWFYLERNRWWTLLGVYPRRCSRCSRPALLAFELALLARRLARRLAGREAARAGRGAAHAARDAAPPPRGAGHARRSRPRLRRARSRRRWTRPISARRRASRACRGAGGVLARRAGGARVGAMADVTVALPVLNGGPLLDEVLAAVRRQRWRRRRRAARVRLGLDRRLGGDRARPRRRGDRDRARHRSRTADAQRADASARRARSSPSSPRTPRPPTSTGSRAWSPASSSPTTSRSSTARTARARDASPSVARELEQFFAAMAPDGAPGRRSRRRADGAWRDVSARASFFTDANGAVARWAWERVPFPDVAYAEDRLLALRMLEAGFAKAYVPDAAVVHSHDYPPVGPLPPLLRRVPRPARDLRPRRAADPAPDARRPAPRGRRRPGLVPGGGSGPARCRPRYPALRPPLRDPRAGLAARLARGPPAPGRPPRLLAGAPRDLRARAPRDHRSRTSRLNGRAPTPRASLLVRIGARQLASLPRRAWLTLRYHGVGTFVWRIVTFPLRFTPLRRYVRRDFAYAAEHRAARRWYRRNGRPGHRRHPHLRRPDARPSTRCAACAAPSTCARTRIVVADDASPAADQRAPAARAQRPGRGHPRRAAGGLRDATPTAACAPRPATSCCSTATSIAHQGWLERLQYWRLPRADDIGIVGPKLLYPDNRIQSAGSYRNLGAPEWFDHRYRFRPADARPGERAVAGARRDRRLHVRQARASSTRSACSTRATRWPTRTSTGACAPGRRAGRSSTTRARA